MNEKKKTYNYKYYQQNLETIKEIGRLYREANRERIAERKRQAYHANAESEREKRRQRYRDNPDPQKEASRRWQQQNAERRKANNAAWRSANRDTLLEKKKEYARQNPEKVLETNRAWRKANPDKKSDQYHRRKAKKLGCEVSATDISRVIANSGGICSLCRTFVPEEFRHIDHIIPLDRGGAHAEDNLQLLCYRCNTSKGAKMPEEVRAETWTSRDLPGQPFLINPNWK